MARIPSSQDINRSVPQFGRQIVSLRQDQSGAALQQFGEGIARAGIKMADEERSVLEQEELAYAESEFLRRQAETMNSLSESQDYDKYLDTYNKSSKEAAMIASGMISNPSARSLFAAKLAPRIETARGSVMDMARRMRDEVSLVKAFELTDSNLSARRMTSDPIIRSSLLRKAEEAIAPIALRDPTKAYQMTKDLYERAAIDDFDVSSIDDKMNAVKYARGEYAPQAGFDNAYSLIQKNEGGFTPKDGASGAPALFGINRKWFPTEFDEVKRLYDEGKVNEAKALARQFYKKEFWDKNGLDKFDASQQAVLLDGVINHSAAFSKELIAAAKDGASASELIDMRQKEYMRLGQSSQYAPSLNGWLNRLENVKKYTGDAYEYFKALSPEKQDKLKQQAEVEYATDAMRFAAPRERAEIASRFADNPVVASQYKQIQESIAKDPAAYVATSPVVAQAQAAFASDATPENQAAYIQAIKSEQRRLGIPEHKVQYIDKAQAEEFKSLTQSANSTPDQVLESLDAMKQINAPVWKDVVGNLRDAGVKGPWAAVASMQNNAYRAELAEAIKMGDAELIKRIPQGEREGSNIRSRINQQVDKVIQPYEAAMAVPNGGLQALGDAREAMQLLSMQYMAKGMSADDAVAEAARGILPGKAYGTIILPEGTDGKPVQAMAEDMRAQFDESDIVVPANLRGEDRTAEALNYAKGSLQKAIPVVSGDEVIFFGPDGFPLLLKDKAEYDEFGNVTNAREAAMSFKIADALTYSEEASSLADPESIGNLRSKVAATIGEDVKRYYSPRASFNGMEYWGRTPKIDGVFITQDSYSAMSPEQKKAAKEKIKMNVEYNQAIISGMKSDDAAASIKQYLQKSSTMFLDSAAAKRQSKMIMKQMAGKKLTKEESEKFREAKKASTQEIIGVGLQYLEIPEWAK